MSFSNLNNGASIDSDSHMKEFKNLSNIGAGYTTAATTILYMDEKEASRPSYQKYGNTSTILSSPENQTI
jgi:hypothetical protein